MSELTEFLEARIAEDEAVAVATRDTYDALIWGPGGYADTGAWGMGGPVDGPSGYASLVVDPARVLAECEAKRRIVDLTMHGCGDDYERVQRALALPYASHPDCRSEWRPQ